MTSMLDNYQIKEYQGNFIYIIIDCPIKVFSVVNNKTKNFFLLNIFKKSKLYSHTGKNILDIKYPELFNYFETINAYNEINLDLLIENYLKNDFLSIKIIDKTIEEISKKLKKDCDFADNFILDVTKLKNKDKFVKIIPVNKGRVKLIYDNQLLEYN